MYINIYVCIYGLAAVLLGSIDYTCNIICVVSSLQTGLSSNNNACIQ